MSQSDEANAETQAEAQTRKALLVPLPWGAPGVAEQIIARYMADESIPNIAREYGISDKRVYLVLQQRAEDLWKEAQVATAIRRLERAEEALDNAGGDAIDITRARESAKLAQWKLERLCRRIYGTDVPNVAGHGAMNVSINLNFARQPVDSAELAQCSATLHNDHYAPSEGDPGQS